MTKRAASSPAGLVAKKRREESECDSSVPDRTLCTQSFQFPQFPDEIQHYIVSKVINPTSKSILFKPSDLVCAGVCKKWQTIIRSLVNNVSLYKLVEDLVARGGDSANQLISHIPEFLLSCKDSLKRLTIEDDWYDTVDLPSLVSNSLLKQILEAATGLDTLVLTLGRSRVQMEATICQSIQMMSSLKTVHLFDGSGFGDTMVIELCNSCPSLKDLTLGLSEITDTAMEAVSQLRLLKVLEFSEIDNLTDAGINALCNGEAHLEVLQLFALDALTNDTALHIASGSATKSSLKVLQLSGVGSLDEDGVCTILEQVLLLKELFLSIVPNSNEGVFTRFTRNHPGKFLSLKYLDYLHENDDFATEFRGAECLPLLEHIHLHYGAYGDGDGPQALQEDKIAKLEGFPNLKIVSIDWSEELTPASAEALGNCSNLEWLHLRAGLDENAVGPLINGLHSKLVKLQVGSVPDECIDLIAAGFPNLTNIWFSGADSPDVLPRINKWSAADVGEWASDEILWEGL